MRETRLIGPCVADLKKLGRGEIHANQVRSCQKACPHAPVCRRLGLMIADYSATSNTRDHDIQLVRKKMKEVGRVLDAADDMTDSCPRR